jgi:signal transduction histidine kinase
MGLAITRSIIAAHRGRVWASQNPKRGITVQVALPACP